mmetsp:Transcript_16239/g.32711  ORF Transcript_16239/g.32711 Transcript_16239/m.32711 type:complete len:92 (+) Transcript_16239:2671-2946(+)
MFRPSSIAALSSKGRTIIRDPRKQKTIRSALVRKQEERAANEVQVHQQPQPPSLPFDEPSTQNQQSLGLGSYMLAGVGVAIGVTVVGAILG